MAMQISRKRRASATASSDADISTRCVGGQTDPRAPAALLTASAPRAIVGGPEPRPARGSRR